MRELLDALAVLILLWTLQQLLVPPAARWLIRRLFDVLGCTCHAAIRVLWWAPVMVIILTPSPGGCALHDADRPDAASRADAEPD